MRVVALAAVPAILMLGLAPDLIADPAEKTRADALLQDGRRFLAAKEYELACIALVPRIRSGPPRPFRLRNVK